MKMSSDEGDNYIEHLRTETSDGLESHPGRTAQCGRSRTLAEPLAPAGAAYAGGLSKGGGRRSDPRESRTQAQTEHEHRGAAAGDRAGPNDVPGLQPTASTRRGSQEREGITLSRSSVHRILQAAGLLAEPKRRKPQHRRRRKRYAQEGMLVQIDGSLHAWLGERGPWLSLIAAIDDATGKIVAAVFREQEDGQGYFLLVLQMVEQDGRPLALYHDRHSIFTHTSLATEADSVQEQLAGKQEPTQFGRLLQELEITFIAARSPQAKGRVERLFGTDT